MRKDVSQIIGSKQIETRFIAVPGDITQPDTGKEFIAKTAEAFGELNVFVSNAGVCKFAEFLECVPQ